MISAISQNFRLQNLEKKLEDKQIKTRDRDEEVLIDEFLTKAVSTVATTALVLGASIFAYQTYNYGIGSIPNSVSDFFKPATPPIQPQEFHPQESVDPGLTKTQLLISSLTEISIFELANIAIISRLNLNPQNSNIFKTALKTSILYVVLSTASELTKSFFNAVHG